VSYRTENRFPKPARKFSSPCPHYPSCFGCPLIHLTYSEQLARKRQRLLDAFRCYPTLVEVEIPPVMSSPRQLGYRARVKLVVRKTKDRVMAGLYVPGSHRVSDISSCPVHPKPVNAVLHYNNRKILELGILPYDERNDTGELRYLDFRYSFTSRSIVVMLVTRHRDFAHGRNLARGLKHRFPFVTGVIQNINEDRGNVIWGKQSQVLLGSDVLVEKFGDLKLGFPAETFSQANPLTAAKIYEHVVNLARLTGQETVLDLYCGAGPISLSLAKCARFVCGVDDHPASIAAAQKNARRNNIVNCRFVAGEVGEGIRLATRNIREVDLIVLNPPRKGVQPRALEAMIAANAPRIIYVSCDPATLARDLERLLNEGYGVSRVQPFDMFPQTEDVETAVLLDKKSPNKKFDRRQLLFRSIPPKLGDGPTRRGDGRRAQNRS
jgi:23S rRNA (uracil1939-C5)-methyltransferase